MTTKNNTNDAPTAETTSKKPATTKKSAAKKPATKKPATKKSSPAKKTATAKVPKSTARKTVKKTSAPKVAKRAALAPHERHERIATVAYFRSIELGYRPGGELQDWLWAEQQVDAE